MDFRGDMQNASGAVFASPVVELRQYTLKPGRREALIGLFDTHFVESQEAQGTTVIGQFRDLDRPDMFVWLRGFEDMETRRKALAAFYGGAVWAAHKDAANDTMLDSDDVLLLRPAWPGSAFDLSGLRRRPAPDDRTVAPEIPNPAKNMGGLLVAVIHHLRSGETDGFVGLFLERAAPALSSVGAAPLAAFVTEGAENTFPRLPVRTGEDVFVTFTRFETVAAFTRCHDRLASMPTWRAFEAEAGPLRAKPTETLRLTPTERSLLR